MTRATRPKHFTETIHVNITADLSQVIDDFLEKLKAQTGLHLTRSDAARKLMELGAQKEFVVPNARSDP